MKFFWQKEVVKPVFVPRIFKCTLDQSLELAALHDIFHDPATDTGGKGIRVARINFWKKAYEFFPELSAVGPSWTIKYGRTRLLFEEDDPQGGAK